MKWTKQQSKALKAVFAWFAEDPKVRQQIFRLFGYAGTGKTTLAKEIANTISNQKGNGGRVLFAAYTGKAASRLLAKGCIGASTIHSLIYKPVMDSQTGQVTGYEINWQSELRHAVLLILDEVSMVNAELAADVLKFGVPVLALGDPGQLPPVSGEGFFTAAEPDFMMTDVRRQALDNPILYLATLARTGEAIVPGTYGSSKVWKPSREVPDDLVSAADQILVGTNRTRQGLNKRVRMLNGRFEKDPVYPVKGDKLICLKNNKDKGLLNGTLWRCNEPRKLKVQKFVDYKQPLKGMMDTQWSGLHFKVKGLDLFNAAGEPMIVSVQVSAHLFDGTAEPPWRDLMQTHSFDFGYATTVHKAQGSEWDHVLGVDESSMFGEHAHRHRYTLFTRAINSVDFFL